MDRTVSVIGSGNVGATVARSIADKELADVVLLDILEGVPQGKGLDMFEACPIEGSDSRVLGTNTYADTAGSDIVVVTAGLARKPGMSRDDLLNKNAGIIKAVTAEVVKHSPDCIIIPVTNSTVAGIPIPQLLDEATVEAIVTRTANGGAEIVKLLGTGSAYYAPGSAVVEMVEAILKDKKKILPCAVFLQGEYGISDLYVGVPVKLGAGGAEQVMEIALEKDEQAALDKSAAAVKELVGILGV